jgi:hypothetical protein
MKLLARTVYFRHLKLQIPALPVPKPLSSIQRNPFLQFFKPVHDDVDFAQVLVPHNSKP